MAARPAVLGSIFQLIWGLGFSQRTGRHTGCPHTRKSDIQMTFHATLSLAHSTRTGHKQICLSRTISAVQENTEPSRKLCIPRHLSKALAQDWLPGCCSPRYADCIQLWHTITVTCQGHLHSAPGHFTVQQMEFSCKETVEAGQREGKDRRNPNPDKIQENHLLLLKFIADMLWLQDGCDKPKAHSVFALFLMLSQSIYGTLNCCRMEIK